MILKYYVRHALGNFVDRQTFKLEVLYFLTGAVLECPGEKVNLSDIIESSDHREAHRQRGDKTARLRLWADRIHVQLNMLP